MIGTLFTLLAVAISPPSKDDAPKPEAVRAAVEKALPLIVKSTAEYPKHRDCFSCHHQAVPVLALATARDRGFTVDAEAISGPVEHTEADLRSAIESYKKGEGQGGGVTRAGYAMLTLEIGKTARDEVTDAVIAFLLKRDEKGDHWRTSSNRPPTEKSDFTTTYLAIRSLAAFGAKDDKDRIADRVTRARKWLESTRPKDTEDRVFRLFALKAAAAEPETLRIAADDLKTTQREDGGWSQLDGGTSDAYATGSALVALHQAGGLATDDPAYRNGLQFLIASQRDDGSWFVASRSKPFQPYFESGFPYGKDQFISMAASGWAVTALALACPATAK